MKTLTVPEAQARLPEIIADVNRGEVIVLRNGDEMVTLCPGGIIDPEEDTPELEAELLKAARGPFTPYSHEQLRAFTEELIAKHVAK